MTNIEDVIKRAAVECHIGLKEDDPIMTLVTAMNQITDDQQKAIQASLEQYREQHEDIAHRWRQDAGETANRILTAALDAGRETLGKGMSEGAAQVIAMIRQENATAVAAQRLELRQAAMDIRKCCRWMLAVNILLALIVSLVAVFS